MDIWNRILSLIEPEIPTRDFRTWLRPTALHRDGGQTIYVRVPNQLFSDWIRKNYGQRILGATGALGRAGAAVEYITEGDEMFAQRPLPLSSDAPAPGDASGLNPKYSFESFVVSTCNEIAHAASVAVAESPSRRYNPLYVYGGVGLGKTHLMQAIGNRARERHRQARVKYVSTETFVNDLIGSIRDERTSDFRNKYRNADILLVDDVQFLARKERTQEEFFHTFNALHGADKQIVITSDCPPKEIPTLEERLRSRFEWGLIVDIQPPDLETKIAILNKKAEAEGIDLPSDVSIFIASKTKSNVRELEGALLRLLAYGSVTGRRLDLATAREVLKDLFAESERIVSIESIQRYVANYYHLRVIDLKSHTNARQISFPRQVAMYLCKALTPASLPEIGRRFGGKHHSTVLHAVRKINDMRRREQDFDRIVNSFIEAFK